MKSQENFATKSPQENFAVKSDDRTLLKAFEEKLIEYGFKDNIYDKNLNNELANSNNIKIYSTSFSYGYGLLGNDFNTITFILPEHWYKAVKYLEQVAANLNKRKEEYEVNDWIITNESRIAKLITPRKTNTKEVWISEIYTNKKQIETYLIYEKEIERRATQEEIYNHLLYINSMNSNIQIGDKVYDKCYKNEYYTVEDICLYSMGKFSKRCSEYFHENGDHLIIRYGNFEYSIPLDDCEKINVPVFETDKETYIAELNDDNCTYKMGCIDNINLEVLYGLINIMEFCKNNHINIEFTYRGEINKVTFPSRLANRTREVLQHKVLKQTIVKMIDNITNPSWNINNK